MRMLSVGSVDFEVTNEKAEKLLSSGAIYECGDQHDLHLNPEHEFDLVEVEMLLTANE